MPIHPTAKIHPTAIIDPAAEIGADVEIGPFCTVGAHTILGAGTVLHANVHIRPWTQLGERNVVSMGAVLGHDPQVVGWDVRKRSYTRIGNENTIREYSTIHRSMYEDGETRLGDKCYLMGFSHLAHDCKVGNMVIMANYSVLAGHVTVGDRVFISGNAAIHQFVRIGTLAIISGLSGSGQDVPPYMICSGRSIVSGINIVGMRRAGCSLEARSALRRAYRLVFRSGLSVPNGLKALAVEWEGKEMPAELKTFIEFCSVQSKRGIARGQRYRGVADEAEGGE